jgi:hypothetical protein
MLVQRRLIEPPPPSSANAPAALHHEVGLKNGIRCVGRFHCNVQHCERERGMHFRAGANSRTYDVKVGRRHRLRPARHACYGQGRDYEASALHDRIDV